MLYNGPFNDEIAEPEGPPGIKGSRNFINFGMFDDNFPGGINDTVIEWLSEFPETVPGQKTFKVLPDLLIDPSGISHDLRIADVPEPSSTITIFGIGLAALAWFARFRRTAM